MKVRSFAASKGRRIVALVVSLVMTAGVLAAFGPLDVVALVEDARGRIRGENHINAADATALRRYLATGTEPTIFVRDNAYVVGGDVIGQADLDAIRTYIAGGELPPLRPTGYFIAITTDDGPHDVHTLSMLNHMSNLNNRPEVVCGMNGLIACVPGQRGRYDYCRTPHIVPCGTQSRAVMTFYVTAMPGIRGWWTPDPNDPVQPTARALMRRMLEDGHAICNHTYDHMMSMGMSRDAIINNQILPTNVAIQQAVHGVTPVTDFYGRTWSNSNPYPPFSFRPNYFNMAPQWVGADEATGQPWMFAGLDVDDWRGHTAREMADFIIHGTLSSCSRGCAWCSITGIAHGGAANGGANGGVILIHDNTSAGARAAEFVAIVTPELQAMGYHIVTVEQLFYYLDAEPALLRDSSGIVAGSGSGTRFNDWVIPGARRGGPIHPHITERP